jgi:hypothetical protein
MRLLLISVFALLFTSSAIFAKDITLAAPESIDGIELNEININYDNNTASVSFSHVYQDAGVSIAVKRETVHINVQPGSSLESKLANMKASALAKIITLYPGTID